MNLSALDLCIILIPLVALVWISFATRGQSKSVADFMAASRVAGRYLVCNARGEAGFGAISAVGMFEAFYNSGFSYNWWGSIGAPIGLLIGLTGFIIYRYRETRCMTLAQFFEVRYSKRFRIFAGFLAFLSGILNYGIFPAVSARFFVYFCGLPPNVHLGVLATLPTFGIPGLPPELQLGGFAIPTFSILMVVFLSVALSMSLTGGQLTIMITDCIAGLVSMLFYVLIAATLIWMFSWSQVSEALLNRPPGKSMLDPFDSFALSDFNIWYVLIGVFGGVYSYMAWQGGHAFNASAANPHEAKMGVILGSWRGFALGVMITLLGVCAYTYMNHPAFAAGAQQVNTVLQGIDNPQIQTQMRVPVALAHFLPVGIKGMFCAIMLFAMLAVDGSYLHSWGSIIIQDVVLPFRKKPFEQKTHIRLLRAAIFLVAAFGFGFGLAFKQTDYVLMFFAITGAIYLGGAGAVIIGGLYWKKGTAAAAWTAMTVGSSLSVGSILIGQFWAPVRGFLLHGFPNCQWLLQHPDKFPINGQYMFFMAMIAAILLYVIVSLLTCREDFNMDAMLHRGRYAPAPQAGDAPALVVPVGLKAKLLAIIGIDSNFTLGDKILSISVFSWGMFWFFVFLVVTAWNLLVARWTGLTWSHYYHVTGVLIPFGIAVVTCVWFTWGGIRDLRRMFASLRTVRRNAHDDGTVVGHRNLDEAEANNIKP